MLQALLYKLDDLLELMFGRDTVSVLAVAETVE